MRLVAASIVVLGLAQASQAEISVDRGAHLVQTIMACGNCHTPLGPEGFLFDQDLTGRLVEKTDAFTAIAPNITPAGPIADWTDEELARAIREGIRPDGSIIGPPMPFMAYRSISDADLADIIAYLRTVPAVDGDPGKSEYNIPLPPAYGPPIEAAVTAPEPGVSVEYGKYLVELGHCMECHSPMTPKGPDWGEGFARGGFTFHGPWGSVTSSNLTNGPDGLKTYSDAEIAAMITKGVRPDGSKMLPPMGYTYYARMTPQEVDAIILYLRSIPGQPNL